MKRCYGVSEVGRIVTRMVVVHLFVHEASRRRGKRFTLGARASQGSRRPIQMIRHDVQYMIQELNSHCSKTTHLCGCPVEIPQAS